MLLGSSSPTIVGLAVIGSQIPDIDSTKTHVGQIFYPIASWLEDRFPHRSVTHSFFGIGVVTLLWAIAIFGFNSFSAIAFSRAEWMALWLGILFNIIADIRAR